MLAVLDGKGKTLMLIIPDLGMGHSCAQFLIRGTVLVTWWGGPGPWLLRIWPQQPLACLDITGGLSYSPQRRNVPPNGNTRGLLSNHEQFI